MSLLLLPSEILQLICTHPSLSLADISSLSITCKRLNDLVNNSWTIIARTRWVWWSSCHDSTNDEWYELCKQRRLCETNLFHILDTEIIKHGVRQYLIDEDDFSVFNELIEGPTSICTQELMECVLTEILNKPINVANLSYQYYGLSLLEYLRRQKLRQELKDLLSLPKHKQLLIQAGIIITGWINPLNGMTGDTIMKEIENISAQVARYLLKIDSITDNDEVIQKLKDASLPAVDVFKGINFILYDKLGFQPAVDDYYHLKNSLINKVLDHRRGIPISLSAIYQSVAHSLGITLLPVNFPAHFLLKYPQDLAKGDSEIFIDAYGRGQLLNQDDCLGLIPFLTIPSPDMFNPVDPYKAMIRMIANIYSRSAINFDVGRQWNDEKNHWGPLVLPSSLSLQLSLCWMSPVSDFTRQVASDAANIALDLRFNVKQVVWVLSDMLVEGNMAHVLTKVQRGQYLMEKKKKALQEPTRVKLRDPNKIQYEIGLIMKHIRYDYYCVIYGWDYTCEMTEAWIHQMGVNQLPLGPSQPFYNVLVNDGTNRYAAQESLSICPVSELRPIRHWEVGKYFKSFTGDRYIPNNALQEKYPKTTVDQ